VKTTQTAKTWQERPGVWLGLLWQALEEQDFAKAGEAQENLARLGIEVRFRRLPQPCQEGALSEEGSLTGTTRGGGK
jgi:hypothetical protein